MENEAKKILNTVFGYDEFLTLQKSVIDNIIKKNDTLVIMPTGGGKSLCYQIPALIFSGLTIVLSPLISLMKDQVEQLRESGVNAVFLNSSLSNREYSENVNLIKQKKAKLLYIAPDALVKENVLEMLSSVEVDCITIDEAHCISSWGHDFRPEYRQITNVRSRFPKAVCVALTATATIRVREDIKRSLNFAGAKEFISSFDRDNLLIKVMPKNKPTDQTIKFLQGYKNQSGIIYCFSRKQVDTLSQKLEQNGFSVRPYHAGLTESQRSEHQELFIKDDIDIIVATVAFGMGINKPNVRFVIHYDLPQNIESYYQEIGRAGRDRLQAQCLLLFGYGDIHKIKHFINQKSDHEKQVANIQLNGLVNFAETMDCRRIPLLTYFGEKYTKENCGLCDNCLTDKKDLEDITIPAQKFLSCVKRTGEMFGAQHIIEVLRGSRSQKVLKFNHDELSTYNIGKEFTKKQWFHLSRQFLQKGLLLQDSEFGGLKLTEKAWKVFRNEEKVEGRIEEVVIETPSRKPKGSGGFGITKYDEKLFDELRGIRKNLAKKAGMPPYIIFSDKSLIEMSAFYPKTDEEFLSINGVGASKCEKYGTIFLDAIKYHCMENSIT